MTHEQVRFLLGRRGHSLEEVLERHAALAATHRAVAVDWGQRIEVAAAGRTLRLVG